MNPYKKSFLFFLGIILSQFVFAQNIKLPPLFSNHIVLQQKTKAAIWGKAAPNSVILITGSWG